MSGRCTSRTTAEMPCGARASASPPLPASAVLNPDACRMREVEYRVAGLSSTTSTVCSARLIVALMAELSIIGAGLAGGELGRDDEGEGRAAPGLALEGHGTPEQFGQFLAQREAQA